MLLSLFIGLSFSHEVRSIFVATSCSSCLSPPPLLVIILPFLLHTFFLLCNVTLDRNCLSFTSTSTYKFSRVIKRFLPCMLLSITPSFFPCRVLILTLDSLKDSRSIFLYHSNSHTFTYILSSSALFLHHAYDH